MSETVVVDQQDFQEKKRLRLERRDDVAGYWRVLTPLLSIFVTLLFTAVILLAIGANPWETIFLLFKGAFGDIYGLEETIIKAVPLMFTGLAVLIAFHMKWWNIGAEGQFYLGAIFAAGTALFVIPDFPGYITIPLMIVAGFIGGGLWAGIAGLLQVWLGMNEIISTLMMNYIAIAGMDYLLYGTWADPAANNFPQTEQFAREIWLPTFPGTRIHIGILIAIVAAGVLNYLVKSTRWGHEVQVIGRSQEAARYAGISIKRNILAVAFISGGLAGLGGMVQISGVIHKLERGLSGGIGFTGIIMAWLAQLNPWAVLVVSILFAGFQVGGDYIQFSSDVPSAINLVLQGALMFFFIGGEAATHYRLRYH